MYRWIFRMFGEPSMCGMRRRTVGLEMKYEDMQKTKIRKESKCKYLMDTIDSCFIPFSRPKHLLFFLYDRDKIYFCMLRFHVWSFVTACFFIVCFQNDTYIFMIKSIKFLQNKCLVGKIQMPLQEPIKWIHNHDNDYY